MLIDLHGHNLVPAVLNQHPHWGPFYELDPGGDFHFRTGDWVLGLSTPERHKAIAEGTATTRDEELARRADPSVRIAAMDALDVDMLVVSLPVHFYMYWAEPEFAISFSRTANDANAAYCSAYPDRLRFWAQLPMQAPLAAAAELERAVTQLGAVGVAMGGANFGGLEADDESLYPLWEMACSLDVPLFIHGHNQSASWGKAAANERYEITSIVGMPYDESRLFWNLICGGVLDHFPQLKVYITHAGGYVPYQLGRFETTNEVLGDRRNKMPVREYMTNFYFDPLNHLLPMRRAIVDTIGVDRLVYGSNFGGSDAIREDLTEGLGLSAGDRQRVRSGNAIDLLRLQVPSPAGKPAAQAAEAAIAATAG